MVLKEQLEQYARQIGIDRLRITTAEPLLADGERLRALSESGMYPPLVETDVELRTHPKRILPGCRSIIAVAVSYGRPSVGPRPTTGPRGLVSRYVQGEDYHRKLRHQLGELECFLRRLVGRHIDCRISVDSGPLLERAVAVRAGLGWLGRNALLYVPGRGSWVFLGALLTDVALPPDSPIQGPNCGSCNRCQQACPTQAIVAPFQVDARRCLSYLTQMPGQVPRRFRKALGRRIWGCDVCQNACPWNQEVRLDDLPTAPRLAPELLPLLTITKGQFRGSFGQTSMGWRGKAVLQRNAALALGNVKDPIAIPSLRDRLLYDPKPTLRGACAWALGEIGGPAALAALSTAQQTEGSADVLDEIGHARAIITGGSAAHS